jgi:predicted transcriptional regulator
MGSSLARRDGLLEERYVDSLPFMLWVLEKAAEVMFPTTQGEFDYKGFSVSSTDGIEWCKELFHHFWDPAKRHSAIPIWQPIKPEKNP